MKNKRSLLIIVILVILAAVVALLLTRNSGNKQAPSEPAETGTTVRISVTDAGFEPATVKVKVGSNVIWTNSGTKSHRVVTNPHTTHDGLTGLDSVSNIPHNGTYTYKFDKPGTFGYHDETDPTHNGTVIVE